MTFLNHYLCTCFQTDGKRTASPRGERARAGRGGLAAAPNNPKNPLKEKRMQEELKQVADLITANTIFCTKEVLTSDEAAKYLGVSKSCLYKWTMTRQIPHYKSPTGKICFFNRQEVEAWMQSNRVATDAELERQAQKLSKKGGKK